jgi:hypothetical protein
LHITAAIRVVLMVSWNNKAGELPVKG